MRNIVVHRASDTELQLYTHVICMGIGSPEISGLALVDTQIPKNHDFEISHFGLFGVRYFIVFDCLSLRREMKITRGSGQKHVA